MPAVRRPLTLAAIGIGLATATACGSSASSQSASTQAPHIPPAKLVKLILPTKIDAARFLKYSPETLKDQFAPRSTRGARAINAVLRRNWLASNQAIFRMTYSHGVVIAVDVNLLKTPESAKRLYRAEISVTPPGQRWVREAAPRGASPGSAYACFVDHKTYNGCMLFWRQGRTVTHIMLIGKGNDMLTRPQAARIAPHLQAIQVQVANRIFDRTHELPGS